MAEHQRLRVGVGGVPGRFAGRAGHMALPASILRRSGERGHHCFLRIVGRSKMAAIVRNYSGRGENGEQAVDMVGGRERERLEIPHGSAGKLPTVARTVQKSRPETLGKAGTQRAFTAQTKKTDLRTMKPAQPMAIQSWRKARISDLAVGAGKIQTLEYSEVDYSALSIGELVGQFSKHSRTREHLFIWLGRIYYHLKKKLMSAGLYFPSRKVGCVGIRTLLIQAGATVSDLKGAGYAASAYEEVIEGRIEETEYSELSQKACIQIFQKKHPLEGRRGNSEKWRAPRVPKENQLPPDDLYETEKSLQSVRHALELAQEWIIRARDCLPEEAPKGWNEQISRCLTPLGRLRFEVHYEIGEDRRKKP